MRKILIVLLLLSCTSNDKPTSNDDEAKNNKNSFIKEKEDDYFYKVKVVDPDNGLPRSSKSFEDNSKLISNEKAIQLIHFFQDKAIKEKKYVGGPPFLQIYIKNELTFDKNIFYYIQKSGSKFFIYYHEGGFDGCEIPKDKMLQLLKYLKEEKIIGNIDKLKMERN